jgi:hypothetical protein
MTERPQKQFEGDKPGRESTGEFENEAEKKAFEEAEARRIDANRPGSRDTRSRLGASRPR